MQDAASQSTKRRLILSTRLIPTIPDMPGIPWVIRVLLRAAPLLALLYANQVSVIWWFPRTVFMSEFQSKTKVHTGITTKIKEKKK